jgi:hypothetical protein
MQVRSNRERHKRIREKSGWVDRCETCDRPSERGERRRETKRRITPQSVSPSSFLRILLRHTARVLAISFSAASTPLALASSTLLHSRLSTWSTRALSTTAAARDAPTPEPNSTAAPAPSPAATPKPKLKPKSTLGLKELSSAELQTQYGHSSDALHALLAHSALFAPLRRPRFPIVLCHGGPCVPCHPCAELSVQGCEGLYGFDVRGPAAFRKMQVHQWKNVLEILCNTVGAEVFVTSVPPCVSSSPSTSPALMPCQQDGVHRRARAGARPRPLRVRVRSRRESDGVLDGRS